VGAAELVMREPAEARVREWDWTGEEEEREGERVEWAERRS